MAELGRSNSRFEESRVLILFGSANWANGDLLPLKCRAGDYIEKRIFIEYTQ